MLKIILEPIKLFMDYSERLTICKQLGSIKKSTTVSTLLCACKHNFIHHKLVICLTQDKNSVLKSP